ncbi:hypothetical protein JL720_5801 [Aureococcus anophagefferens]|nr:hypothetical protein JL720_5801 [Aureococcus anophagefferens]
MNTDEIQGALVATLSPDVTVRRQAEAYGQLPADGGVPVLLLQLVQQHCARRRRAQSPVLRSSAAVYFKNLVKKGWDVDPESKETPVAAGDRDAIKSHMVTLVCACGKFGDVKQQLSQALTLIASTDFPGKWPNLLPEIVARFADGDAATVQGMLLTSNSILKRFRYAFKSDALYAELKCALDTLAAPLTRLFGTLGEELRAAAGDAARSAVALESLRLACREFLAYEAPGAAADDEDDDEGPVERLQAAVERGGKRVIQVRFNVENASLYAHKYEEEFQPHLPQFVSGIWQRLMKTSLFPKHDRLAATSMRFLAEVVGQQMHAALFADESTLRQVVEAIVIPNMTLRDSDVELFEDNAVEYISRDLESADSETRRRGARDLVHAMCKHHDATTTKICGEHVAAMLGRYGASPGTEWRAKDAALHLVVSLAVRAESSARGVSKMSDQLDILEIYSAHVAPELGGATATHGVVLADCVQFACTSRNQIPGDELLRLLPLLGGHLGHGDVVVQSYAAHCLERVLAVPGCVPGKIHRPQLAPLLPALFQALFAVIDGALAKGGDAPWENEYVMKAVMRLLVVGQADVVPHAAVVTEKLCASLGRVCANPRNPKFNHYLFESLAVLSVLQMDVVEFAPYVFQILALLLGYRAPRSGLGDAYAALLPPLLHPSLWERRGNVPELAALLEAYLVAGPDQILAAGQLEPMLGVFQKLLASKASEGHAFGLLKSLVVHVPQANLDGYVPTVLQLLLTRLQQNRDRLSYCHNLLAFLGLLAGKHGAPQLVAKLDAQQPGLLPQLVVHVLAPHVLGEAAAFASAVDAKAAAVGAVAVGRGAGRADAQRRHVRVVLPRVRALHVARLAGAALAGDATIDRSDDVPDELLAGYDATFSKLHFGTQKSDDAFAEIPDTQTFAMTHLTQLVATKPHFQPLLAALQQPR